MATRPPHINEMCFGGAMHVFMVRFSLGATHQATRVKVKMLPIAAKVGAIFSIIIAMMNGPVAPVCLRVTTECARATLPIALSSTACIVILAGME